MMGLSVPCFADATSAYLVMEADSLQILAAQNADVRLPMASLTKIMTAVVVIENCKLSKTVTIQSHSVGIEGSSMYLKAGEKYTVEELLYGLMLVSGNDAADALAYACAGSIEDFADLMNKTAKSIGLADTSFANPSGLDADHHYTTAFDLAKLAAHALQNKIFCKIVGTKVHKIGAKTLVNHNRLLREIDGCIGVKTGYTKACGRCLVSAVQRNGVTLICVTLNCHDDWDFHKKMYADNFDRCKRIEVPEKSIYLPIAVAGGHTAGAYAESVSLPVIDQNNKYITRVHLPRFVYYPKIKGDCVGSVSYYIDHRLVKSVPLVLDRDLRPTQKKFSLFAKIKEFVLHIFRF